MKQQPQMTPGQAHYILTRLIESGAVRAGQIKQHLNRIPQEIATLEARLAVLRPSPSTRRAPNAAVQASRELQGRYMGLMRHVGKTERAKAKRICHAEGRATAVAFLESLRIS